MNIYINIIAYSRHEGNSKILVLIINQDDDRLYAHGRESQGAGGCFIKKNGSAAGAMAIISCA